jgi:Fe-S cluster assembly protein SufD
MLPLREMTLSHVGDGDPPWRSELRGEGHEAFRSGSMPSPRHEQWRYIDLGFDLNDLRLASADGTVEPDPLTAAADAVESLQVVDGVTGPGGSRLRSLRLASKEDADVARAASVAATPVSLDLFAAAHAAFGGDGALLHMAKRDIEPAPFYVDVVAASEGVSFPAIWVEMEEGSSASLVVHLRSSGDHGAATVVPQFAAHIGPNARLQLTIVQNLSYRDRAIAHARLVADRDASIGLFEVGVGGSLARLHLTVDLEGDGSHASVLGAYFGEESQTIDYRYFMNHIGRNTRSDMFLKGAVEDEAVSVFTGMIRIEETGQKTEAFQTNRNLLLSDGATAQSVPNLEILANDVKCGHASSVGPLDDEQRYYLMSRGLDRRRADRLQVRGFFEEVLARIPQRSIVPTVRSWINGKYVSAQEAGRV